jgi:hypothetical protein
MGTSSKQFTRARRAAGLGLAALFFPAMAVGVLAGGDKPPLGDVRGATAAYHDLAVAEVAGYESFYVCTDKEGVGTMGQHYVNFALLGDPSIDALRPESLVYEPRKHGGYKLVAVEWIVFKADWDATHAGPPALFGQEFAVVPVPNRYGVPAPFYELHAWIWKHNPLGMFDDWNPKATCRGTGDPA